MLADAVAQCLAPDFLKKLGITRVGDLTGLDTIGLPVWFAVQPNSRTLAVSQGKGLTHDQARISAVMEAAESAIAERPEKLIERYCSLEELIATGGQAVPLERLSGCMFEAFDPQRERAWVPGTSWTTGKRDLRALRTDRPRHADRRAVGPRGVPHFLGRAGRGDRFRKGGAACAAGGDRER